MMRRASSKLLAAGVAVAVLALASTMYQAKLHRDYSAPTAIVRGHMVRTGVLLGMKNRSSGSGWICWVAYRFVPEHGVSRQGWGLWPYACDAKQAPDIPIEYVVANPDTNRPVEGGGPPVPPLFLWFAAGVIMVVGVLRRGSESSDDAARDEA